MADVTLEEMEREFAQPTPEETAAAAAAAAAPKPDDSLPEPYRGKSMSEIVAELEANKRALQISEDARVNSRREAAQPAPAPAAPARKTREELQAMMQEDAMGAIELITQYAREDAENHIERRLQGLQAGTLGAAEHQARQKYGVEFELFGDDIKKFVDSLPDKSSLNSQQAWDDVVSYVRGRDGNIQKYIERVTSKPNAAEEARRNQEANSGATFTGRSSSSATVSGGTNGAHPMELDDVQKKIADEFIDAGIFKNREEYARSLNTR